MLYHIKCCQNCSNRKIACHVDCVQYCKEALEVKATNELISKNKKTQFIADKGKVMQMIKKNHKEKKGSRYYE